MRIPVRLAAAVSAIWPVSAGATTLEPPTPGLPDRDNTFVLHQGIAGHVVALYQGEGLGSTPLTECPGLAIDAAGAAQIGELTLDDAGAGALLAFVMADTARRGAQTFQAVDLTGCTVSEAVSWTFRVPDLRGVWQADIADGLIVGEAVDDLAGLRVSGAGDVNGDGLDDMWVAAPWHASNGRYKSGAIYLVHGPAAGDTALRNAPAKLTGELADDQAGYAISGGVDLSGDGVPDLLVGARWYDGGASATGAAYLVLGPVSGEISLGASAARMVGEEAGDNAGSELAAVGDLDGDGLAEAVIGALYADGAFVDSGRASVVFGPIGGERPLVDAETQVEGTAAGALLGSGIAGPGDVDGDGYADLVLGAPGTNDGPEVAAGAAYVFRGPLARGDLAVTQAHATLFGSARDGAAGTVDQADLDGDGRAELLLGARGDDDAGTDAGAAWVVAGGVAGTLLLDQDTPKRIGEGALALAGGHVRRAGDIDGDGLGDVLVGAHGDETGGYRSGAAYVLFGPVLGRESLATADTKIWSDTVWDELGVGLSAVGDMNGDGRDDFALGAEGANDGGDNSGSAYVFYGRSQVAPPDTDTDTDTAGLGLGDTDPPASASDGATGCGCATRGAPHVGLGCLVALAVQRRRRTTP